MTTKTYQVWHDAGWPQSRLNETLGGWPASRFPEHFIHVANVQANGLREAVALTTDNGSILDDSQPFISWEKNGRVEALVRYPRETDAGDVVVDPNGRAYRVEHDWFTEIQPSYERLIERLAPADRQPRPETAIER